MQGESGRLWPGRERVKDLTVRHLWRGAPGDAESYSLQWIMSWYDPVGMTMSSSASLERNTFADGARC